VSTDSPTDPAPAAPEPAPEPVLAHELVPDPVDYGSGPATPLADVVRYRLARAQGFAVGMDEFCPTGDDDVEHNVWGAYVRSAVSELHLALLLAELQAGTPLEVAATRVPRYIEDGGAAMEWLWEHGQRLGVDLDRVRAYPLAAAIGRDAEDSLVEYRRARELAAKHPHRIVPTLEEDGRGVTWEAFCDAGPEAWCRATFDCGCESVVAVERDEQGRWSHRTAGAPDDEPKHVMEPGGRCHQLDFLNADQSLLPEAYTGGSTPARAGRIVLTWEGEDYSWDYADEATS